MLSGGVGSIEDVINIKQVKGDLEGFVVGKALYDGKISFNSIKKLLLN